MKKLLNLSITLIMVMALIGCNDKEKIADFKAGDVEKIVITLAMGNPDYGADSKTITDEMEIQQIVDVFNNATLEGVVSEENLGIGATSTYAFYDDEKCLKTYAFNVNNSEILFWGNEPREVIYEGKSPYQLYEESISEVVTVDLQGNELNRNHVAIINPLVEVENADIFKEAFGIDIKAPKDAVDIEYYILNDKISQIVYVIDGKKFDLRASKSIVGQELSGIHGDFEMITYVACGDTVSVTVATAELDDGSAFATSTVEMMGHDTVYLALSTTNQITGDEISSMLDDMSYEMADEEAIETMVYTEYYELEDGTWKCDQHTYKYKLTITGRLNNADKDITYTILSNIKDITFEEAWKASGLSSNSTDYFKKEDAVFVASKVG